MQSANESELDMPTLDELLACAVPFRVPLRTRFRGVTHREGLLLSGPRGESEFAPFDDYSDAGAARWLAAAIDAAWGSPPPVLRESVPVNAIIPDADVPRTAEFVRAAAAAGCSTMKVKVAAPDADSADAADVHERDMQRLKVVREILNAEFGMGKGALRLDANAAWSADDAIKAIRRFADMAGEIEYVEQPCVTLDECAEVRAQTGVRIAIDEGLRLAADIDAETLALVQDAADVVIVKPIPMGGWPQVRKIVKYMQRPIVISGSMDTSIGLAYALAVACAVPDLPFACGLGTGSLLAGDLVTQSLVPVNGMLHRQQIHTDANALAVHSLKTSDPRYAWWLQRLQHAAQQLPGIGSVTP